MINTNESPTGVKSFCAKAEWTSHFIFSLIALPFCIMALVVTFRRPDQWHALLFTVVACAFPQLWLYGFEIVLSDEKLFYKTLFSFRKEMDLSNLAKAKIETGIGSGLKARTQPYYRLNLYDNGNFAKNPLVINMKPFGRSDLARVAKTIIANAPAAKIDKAVISLSQGSIKPVERTALQQIWKAVILIFVLFMLLGIGRAFFLLNT